MKILKAAALSIAVIVMLAFPACGIAPGNAGNGVKPAKTPELNKESKAYALECVLPTDGPSFKLSLADSAMDDDSYTEFTRKLKEQSGGKIEIFLFRDGKLGGDREIMEGVQKGNISIALSATSAQLEFIPEVAVFDMPGVYKSYEQSSKVLNGKFKKVINESYNKAGLELISLYPAGFRTMSANKQIRNLEDFRGLRIRTTDNKYQMEFWRNLGAIPFALPFSELYLALQQNLVDAQENPFGVVASSRLYEVQKYVVEMNYIMMVRAMVMNKKVYDSMPPEYQQLIAKLAEERIQISDSTIAERQDKLKKFLMDNGVKFIELPEGVKAKVNEACLPIIASIRKSIGDSLVDTLLQEIEAAGK